MLELLSLLFQRINMFRKRFSVSKVNRTASFKGLRARMRAHSRNAARARSRHCCRSIRAIVKRFPRFCAISSFPRFAHHRWQRVSSSFTSIRVFDSNLRIDDRFSMIFDRKIGFEVSAPLMFDHNSSVEKILRKLCEER